MKTFFVISLLLLSFGGTARAQQGAPDDPATREDVQKYLDAIHSHDMMKQMTAAMAKPMQQMVHEQFLKDKDKLPPDFETRMNKTIGDMMNDLPLDEMMQAMVPVYQKHFTKADITALLAYYSSPIGQKMLRELPTITAEAMQTMMPVMRKYTDGITARIQEQVAEMLKESQKKPGPGSTPTRN